LQSISVERLDHVDLPKATVLSINFKQSGTGSVHSTSSPILMSSVHKIW